MAAMEIRPKENKKYGGVVLYNPNQTAYAVSYEFKGCKFVFFKGRGCLIGKGLKKSYDMKGNVVSDYTWEDVVEHFKGLGFKVKEQDSLFIPKEKKKSNSNTSSSNNSNSSSSSGGKR